MATKEITPIEYAKMKKCTLQNVTKLLRNNRSIDGVIEVKKFSRFYVLVVDKKLNEKTFKKK